MLVRRGGPAFLVGHGLATTPGVARFESNMAEQEYGDVAYAPFGETYSVKNSPYLSFTGQNPDTFASLHDFQFREHSPAQGRWFSPDPAGMAAADFSELTAITVSPLNGWAHPAFVTASNQSIGKP